MLGDFILTILRPSLGFVARVFDLVFLEGLQAVFKVAVALLGQHLPLILECDSFESLVEFLKNTLPALSTVQMERVIGEAFELEEDISKYLNAYQIEYHIFQEELAISPGHYGRKWKKKHRQKAI